MGKLYITNFKVRGNNNFPMDMLRWDCCYPRQTEDAISILMTLDQTNIRDIELQHANETKGWEPTKGRWRSFGWIVTKIEEIK